MTIPLSNKELEARVERLIDTTIKKELSTIDICFGIDAKPTYSFDVYLGPKNDNDKSRNTAAHHTPKQKHSADKSPYWMA
ncbi:MAG: hypothetical protein HN791_01285 [Gammaproteobacteria bacterium]|jgi:hypothetical protein|nr:hypothetical protein [Gammaproteobacteria bacterium]